MKARQLFLCCCNIFTRSSGLEAGAIGYVTVVLISLSLIFTAGCTQKLADSRKSTPAHKFSKKPKIVRQEPKCLAYTLTEYKGAVSCEGCHKGKMDEVTASVHYKQKALVTKIRDVTGEWGMANLIGPYVGGYALDNWLSLASEDPYISSGCGQCHVSGVKPSEKVSQEEKSKIDCLVCHATKYDMSKRKVVKDESGSYFLSVDKGLASAQSVKGVPTADACLRCHLKSGGGINFNRGTPYHPLTDVHAAKKMYCVDCHKSKDHKIAAGNISDIFANELPEVEVNCQRCHDVSQPDCVNDHERLACVTCHVPVTRGLIYRDITDLAQNEFGFYDYAEKVEEATPVYLWSAGMGNKNWSPIGSRKDKKAKIYPYKKAHIINVADALTKETLPVDLNQLKLTGDVDSAIKSITNRKVPYSGKWKPQSTTVYRQLSHSVTKDKALHCQDCHLPDGVLDWQSLGYTQKEARYFTSQNKKFGNL